MKDKKRDAEPDIDHSDEIKRLNRVVGQVDGIRKMLENQRPLDDVLIQCKAIHSALKSIETRLLRSHLESAMDDLAKMEKRKNREQLLTQLEELFRYSI